MSKTLHLDLDVLTIGETLVDLISEQEVETLGEAGVFRKFQGGSPANIAANVARLGGRAAVVSKTGIGAFGSFLKGELQKSGVITDYMVMDHRVHTSLIFVSRTSGTPDFEAFRDADYKLTPAEIDEEAIRRARIVHASTFALSRKPCRDAVRRVFEIAHENGQIISLDPNYSPVIWPNTTKARKILRKLMGYVNFIKPSLDDARRLWGEERPPEEYIQRFHELGPETIVLTMGKEGVLLSERGVISHIPMPPVEVVDATGAGDAFWAGFLTALLDGRSNRESVLFGMEVAAMKIRIVGPLPDEIDRKEIYRRVNLSI
jgi:fructokinase